METKYSAVRRGTAILAVLCLIGFVVGFSGFYPGLMSKDTVEQLAQARSATYSDWHPVSLALLWRLLLPLKDGPEPMLALQCAVFWGSVFLIGRECCKRWNSALGAAIALVGFSPTALIYMGVIWKDVQMAFGFLLAYALLFLPGGSGFTGRLQKAAALAALVFGAVSRHNSWFAWLGLLPLFAIQLGRNRKQRVAWGAAIGLLLLATPHLLSRSVGAKHAEISQYFQLYDLTGISLRVGTPIFPSWITKGREINLGGLSHWYSVNTGDWLFYREGHPFEPTASPEELRELRNLWLGTLIRHPLQALHHRWQCFLSLMGWDPEAPRFVIFSDPQNQPTGLGHEPLYGWLNLFLGTPLYLPWIWMYFGLLGIGGALGAIQKYPERKDFFAFPLALFASGLLYALTYFIVMIDNDFRYLYWPLLAISVGAVQIIGELWTATRERAALSTSPATNGGRARVSAP